MYIIESKRFTFEVICDGKFANWFYFVIKNCMDKGGGRVVFFLEKNYIFALLNSKIKYMSLYNRF